MDSSAKPTSSTTATKPTKNTKKSLSLAVNPRARNAKTGKPERPPLRRAIVVAGRLDGKPLAEIAKDAGCVQRTVIRELQRPETKALMSELVAQHRDQICRGIGGLVGRAVRVIESDTTQHEEAMRAGDRLLTMVQAHDREVTRLAELQLGSEMDGMMLEELMLVRRVLMARRQKPDEGAVVEGTVTE